MSYGRPPVDWHALRKAANANLGKIADGTYRREREAEQARRRAEKDARRRRYLELQSMKRKLKSLRKELKDHEREWQWLYDKHEAGKSNEVGDFGIPDIVVLEEVDATRNQMVEDIVQLEDNIWTMEILG